MGRQRAISAVSKAEGPGTRGSAQTDALGFRWLPFKIVSFISAVILVAHYGYMTGVVSLSTTLPEETSFDLPEPASPTEAHVQLWRQAALLRPLVATMDESE